MYNFFSLDRFFLGGPLSVRGFDFKGIGPRRGGNIVLFCFVLKIQRNCCWLIKAYSGGILFLCRSKVKNNDLTVATETFVFFIFYLSFV